MNSRKCILLVVLTLALIANSVSLCADKIQIPKYYTEQSVVYLANQLGLRIIYSNYYAHPEANKFSMDVSLSKDSIVKGYNEKNDFLSMSYDSDNALLISCEKEKGLFFNELLGARISLDSKQNAFFATISGKKYKIIMKGESSVKERIGIQTAVVREWGKSYPTNPTLKELILTVFKQEGQSNCYIAFWVQPPLEAVNILKQAVSDGDIPREVMDNLPQNATEQTSYKLVFLNSNEEWKKPTYEQIAECLKSPKRDLRIKSPARNFEFWFRQALTFDTASFIKYLIDQNLFDLASSRREYEVKFLLPKVMLDSGDYKAIGYLIKNIDKIKNTDIQTQIVYTFEYFADKSRLDSESLDLLASLAKKFNVVKKPLADTSRWVGDDLPEDYDRWQNFKVSETELVFECDKAIATTKYHLKFFKYKEPVKIGGIPLKKMEEADYSTPEKAYFSTCSERTYEWSKTSVYDIANYNEDDFSVYNKWKYWHSGFDPFILILYKVEISQIGNKKKDSPDLFLVIKVLSDANRIAAIPMKLDGKKWKFYLCWPRDAEILSGYIGRRYRKRFPKSKMGSNPS